MHPSGIRFSAPLVNVDSNTSMIRVQVRPNEPLESALRRFKRQCNYAGIFRLAKKYAFYEKRSDRRRREERERIRNIQRAMRRQGQGPSKSKRRGKVRASTVTPESARAAAEAEDEPVVETTAQVAQTKAQSEVRSSAKPEAEQPKVTSAQQNEA